MVAPFLLRMGYDVSAEKIETLLPMYIERASDLVALASSLSIYFKSAEEIVIEDKAMKALNEDGKHQLSVLHDMIADLPEFNAESLDKLLHEYVEQGGLKFKQVGPPLRSALTGLAGGPSVHDVMAGLGREESLKRIERAMA
jgi:glutamyl-tRNA synthetase